ncbi:hypothetical protein [Mucisphaera sp.]|uniref:hypothetical protein n=1 Tax=Mucisphaera sp. TaxID=2913024 RepID=UPI003D1433FF
MTTAVPTGSQPAFSSAGGHADGEGMCEISGHPAYRITGFEGMEPFLVSLLSEGDMWCFVSSMGSLTAGRVEPAYCLFPYVTDNEIHQAHGHTGPVSVLRVSRGGEADVWRPLEGAADEQRSRSLAKTVLGDRLMAEEHHREHGLLYRAQLAPTAELGLIRTVTLENTSQTESVEVEVLDGFRGLLPANIELSTLSRASCLIDAYTQAEALPDTGLTTISLTSCIVDSTEPSEALYANTAWATGLPFRALTLDVHDVERFVNGEAIGACHLLQGQRSAYLVQSGFRLEPGERRTWHVVLDSRRSQRQVVALQQMLGREGEAVLAIEGALERTHGALLRNVDSADAAQVTGDSVSSAHHVSNVLFNNARGGVPVEHYAAPAADLLDFTETRHRPAVAAIEALVEGREKVSVLELLERVRTGGDPNVQRLLLEYLPLTFGRRHGDPSRPWNYFAIHVQDEHGEPVLNHQGNWRDIFQNWEALALSYPGFLPQMISKFVNASTVDGFNPYRITRDGIDWEKPNPEDPWANIGYWGDHQLIYLLRLLELLDKHDPDALEQMLRWRCYSYADVPYRIKPYADLVRDPRDTILFDAELDRAISVRVERLGTDGRLLLDTKGEVHHVGLLEKLLVPLLSKLSNLVPEGGIWMNTQRPEWNDANNALAGYGISVVTLAYLHRYAGFIEALAERVPSEALVVSERVLAWLTGLAEGLGEIASRAGERMSDVDRKAAMDRLGRCFEAYRNEVYTSGPGDPVSIDRERLVALLRDARAISREGLAANRREDQLYYSYNVINLDEGSAEIQRLPLMLEGQVAVLSSGALGDQEAIALLEALFASSLYRDDQKTFMLYPRREMPGFLDRGRVPEDVVSRYPLLRELEAAGDGRVIQRDDGGAMRFVGSITNRKALEKVMDGCEGLSREARLALFRLHEEVFRHRSYTGRSGSMFAYEGNGCIYWHMVAKLLLAAQESGGRTVSAESGERLRTLYRDIRSGLGFNKTASEYGAFPLDAYSHSAWATGARQPGMTGQVKEEVITRWYELGIRVEGGCYRFAFEAIDETEWLGEPGQLVYHDLRGELARLDLQLDELALTICQTPVVYRRGGKDPVIEVHEPEGGVQTISGHDLPRDLSASIMRREGRVSRLVVVG